MDTPGNIFHVNFLGYAHWFISVRISKLNKHSASVDHSSYDTSVVEKYLETSTIKEKSKFHKTTLTHDMILAKEDNFTSDEKMEVLSTEYKIQYRSRVGSLIYLLYTIVNLCFTVHKLAKFSSIPGRVHFEGLVYLLMYIRYNKNLGLIYYAKIKDAPIYDLLI